jgi:hypothetical protein
MPQVRIEEIPVPENIAKEPELIKVVSVESPTRPAASKLYITLEVKLYNEQGKQQIEPSAAMTLLESFTAKQVAISTGQKALTSRCGWSDQSRVIPFANGEPVKNNVSPDAFRITYTVLASP